VTCPPAHEPSDGLELTVLMPCLDEAETADNGSTDGSPEIAERHGARVEDRGPEDGQAAYRATVSNLDWNVAGCSTTPSSSPPPITARRAVSSAPARAPAVS
jgi:hypothetical protein